jgi:hypothetical protein
MSVDGSSAAAGPRAVDRGPGERSDDSTTRQPVRGSAAEHAPTRGGDRRHALAPTAVLAEDPGPLAPRGLIAAIRSGPAAPPPSRAAGSG